MAELGVDVAWVGSRSVIRVCTTLVDHTGGVVTELVENAAPLEPSELAAFIDTFRKAAIDADLAVLSGSLPRELPPVFTASCSQA